MSLLPRLSVPLAAVFAFLLPGAGTATVPGRNGLIVFGTRVGLFVIRPDGTGLTRLTDSYDRDPVWSPDGREIAFVRDSGGVAQIYAAPAAGGAASRLTSAPLGSSQPTWSPDGREIAFERDETSKGGGVALYLMAADGTDERLLLRSGKLDLNPDWSPDGRRIVFQRGLDRVFVVNADGSGVSQISRGRSEHGPAWSPGGNRIAVEGTRRPRGDRPGIYVMRPDGRGLRLVRYGYAEPSWSPDGTKLVVFRIVGTGEGAIYVIRADGRGKARALASGPFAEHPDWQRAAP